MSPASVSWRTPQTPTRPTPSWTTCCRSPAQSYFASEVFEYPLVAGIGTEPSILPLSEIHTPDIDLSDLHDLQGTLALLESVGVL